MQTLTLIKDKTGSKLTYELMISFLIVSFLAFAGRIYLFLPHTPIPVVFSNSAALILGVYLSRQRAVLGILFYLLLAELGLPILAGGHSGIIGASSGYLFGYIVSAYLITWLRTKWGSSQTIIGDYLYLCIGNLTLYLLGATYLGCLFGFDQALDLGVYPFLIGDFLIKPFLLSGSFRGIEALTRTLIKRGES